MSIALEIERLRGRAADGANVESQVARMAKSQGRAGADGTEPGHQRGIDISRNLAPLVRPVITRMVRAT